MESCRLPRFKRAHKVTPIQITERDHTIIQLVHRHRFLRSSHIVQLLGDSSQSILRRLQLLYHHGYLERPRAQIDYYHQGGSRHIVYGLGAKGGSFLKQEEHPAVRWGERNRSVGRIYLEHALLVSDIMVAMKSACRQEKGIRLLGSDELSVPKPLRWRVNIGSGIKLGVIPDRVFALEFIDEDGTTERAYFFLEADRGTMPVMRRNLSQTSFHRKLLAYEATWSQGLHRSHFGFHRFQVLTITKSAERVTSLLDACSQLKRGHGLFLFTDEETLAKHGNILTLPWQSGRSGEVKRLIDL